MTTNGSAQIVSKLWNYCNVLRDDGMSYGDYVEQLTYLLFLIKAIVDLMRPTPADTICDPAAGTCGFLLAAYDYILRHHHPLDRDQLDHVTHHALRGWEIVDNAARLGVMNLHLHGIGANAETSPFHVCDSLASYPA